MVGGGCSFAAHAPCMLLPWSHSTTRLYYLSISVCLSACLCLCSCLSVSLRSFIWFPVPLHIESGRCIIYGRYFGALYVNSLSCVDRIGWRELPSEPFKWHYDGRRGRSGQRDRQGWSSSLELHGTRATTERRAAAAWPSVGRSVRRSVLP